VALVALAWAVLVPGGVFWTALVAAGVIGSLSLTYSGNEIKIDGEEVVVVREDEVLAIMG
jgi:hypothetical protein